MLKATWKKAPYTITYELMGGTNSKYNPQNFYMDELPLRLSKATKEGYIFTGWTLNGKSISSIPTDAKETITLSANWEKESKKGCKKNSAAQIIFSISLLVGTILILRKKH